MEEGVRRRTRRRTSSRSARWDGAAIIVDAIKAQKGKMDPDKTMEFFKHWKNPNSPRGPISIDPETRDIVQNEYLREVKQGRRPARQRRARDGRHGGQGSLERAAEEEVELHPGRATLIARQRRLPRRRLRHDPVRDLGGPVGDDGPDGLRQPGARRVRHGGRLRFVDRHGALRRAVSARRWSPRSCWRCGEHRRSSGCSTRGSTAAASSTQVLFTSASSSCRWRSRA